MVKKRTSKKKTSSGMNCRPPGILGVVIEATPKQRIQSAQIAAKRRPKLAFSPAGAQYSDESLDLSSADAIFAIYPNPEVKMFYIDVTQGLGFTSGRVLRSHRCGPLVRPLIAPAKENRCSRILPKSLISSRRTR